MPSIKLCIAVFCGLPASGKTSVCELVCELAAVRTTSDNNSDGQGRSSAVVHVCYDDIIPQINVGDVKCRQADDHQQGVQDKNSSWREYRRQIVLCVDHILGELLVTGASLHETIMDLQSSQDEPATGTDSWERSADQREIWSRVAKCFKASLVNQSRDGGTAGKLIVLVDDNMFYRSMRYEYYQLARKYSAGYCQVGLLCSTQTAVARNSVRTNQIPEETIITMATKMEEPDASKASWEKNSLLADASQPIDHCVLGPVWMLIQSALESPVPPVEEEDMEAKEQSRAACAASLVHQSDQVLRKCISDIMASSRDKLNKEKVCELALQLNRARTTLLDEIRVGSLVLPCHQRDSDLRAEFDKFLLDRLHSRCQDVL